ncbi:hypothetical protein F0919_10160 [Taibaiella lutea]|uniref:Transposase IS200-like domain-containing protein n=1 Tax=Taibaiella lutea TaxID=2608001 RepID=A0A5M6CIV8_9BACT|nr:hypothetical protein [Taibaiella lutea]KAA5534953.1 hypothetical protein F0919_10160 [Taibaiella lutea]
MKYVEKFKPESYYHIFNHAVGNDNLFRNEDNYYYFLKRYVHYILPIAKTFSYCLLPNHFHLFIQFRTEAEILSHYCILNEGAIIPDNEFDFHKFLMQQFSNFLNSYTKSINKRYNRKGALFLDYTRRIEIVHPQYYRNLVHYIHNNPVKHGFCLYPEEWKFSSYSALFRMDISSRIEREQMIEWFNGDISVSNYNNTHNKFMPELYVIE